MEEDPEKRFHSIMDKLLNAPSKSLTNPSSPVSCGVIQIPSPSRGKKRDNPESALALVEPTDKTRVRAEPVSSADAPLCRPWDRGDLMRRLATYKSMTWFAKPKVVSAVNCARRGWINLDIDIIACEACGTRLLFSTPSSWSQQQVEKAALVFSFKLDNGHKPLCPWIDNTCDERLAEFPPTPPQVLVEKFSERSCALLRLSALPLISSSAIEYIRCPQVEEFLGQSPTLEFGNTSGNLSQIQFLGNDCDAGFANLYYEAQKLISLCGWELRVLPYVVDCKDIPTQPVKDTDITSIQVHSVATEQSVDTYEESGSCSGPHADSNAVVLDCRFCGASVGLWTFSMVPCPLEMFKLVGYAEVNSNKNSELDSANENHVDNRGVIGNSASNGALSSMHRPSYLSFTIAGGPPPTKQNFKATISLPVIGRNLRARFSYDSDFRDCTCDNQEVTRSGPDNKNLSSEERESAEHNFGEQVSLLEAGGLLKNKTHDQGQCSYASGNQSSYLNFGSSEGGAFRKEKNSKMSVEGIDITREPTFPETARHDSAVECPAQSPPNTLHGYDATAQLPENSNNIELLDSAVGVSGVSQVSASSISSSAAIITIGCGKGSESNSLEMVTSSINHVELIPGEDISGSKNGACQIAIRGGETCSDIKNTLGAQEKRRGNTGVQVSVNSEDVANVTGNNPKKLVLDKALGFDPIRQHRHFCPWIISTSSGAPGWQQTLSALRRQKEFSPPTNSPSSSLNKVDDPIALVRKLFTSPVKKMKPTS
uniref:C3HC-type domain-containing protein n=1 Tax=Salix viminalis TaxID=40686 RepID=A0A6N2KSF5_SALVM